MSTSSIMVHCITLAALRVLRDHTANIQDFVKLVSAEGAEFWVDRKCAMVSGTIKAMLSGENVEHAGEAEWSGTRGREGGERGEEKEIELANYL